MQPTYIALVPNTNHYNLLFDCELALALALAFLIEATHEKIPVSFSFPSLVGRTPSTLHACCRLSMLSSEVVVCCWIFSRLKNIKGFLNLTSRTRNWTSLSSIIYIGGESRSNLYFTHIIMLNSEELTFVSSYTCDLSIHYSLLWSALRYLSIDLQYSIVCCRSMNHHIECIEASCKA